MKLLFGSKPIRSNQKNLSMAEAATKPQVLDLPLQGCYTLVMVDPDAGKTKPNDPRPGNSDRYYLHWLVVNISGGDLSSGRQIVQYQKPTPPPGTGKHEYKFLLFSQPCGLTQGLDAPESLSNWSLQHFVESKGLALVQQQSMYVGQ